MFDLGSGPAEPGSRWNRLSLSRNGDERMTSGSPKDRNEDQSRSGRQAGAADSTTGETSSDPASGGRCVSLEENPNLLPEALQNVRFGLSIWCLENPSDLDSFQLVMSNPTAERALGAPAEEMQRGTLRQSFPSTIEWDIPTVLHEVVLSGQARELGELRSGDRPFSQRFFRLRAFPLPDHHVGVVFEDITERRNAEEIVRRQAQLLDLAHDAIIVRDTNSRVISWSHGAQRTYGWTKEEALGKITHTLLKTQFPFSFEEVQNSLFLKGWWEGELIHTTQDGRQIVVASRQVTQRDESGQAPGPHAILEINRDITEHRKAESLLATEKQALEMIARRAPLSVVLDLICRGIQDQAPAARCSFVLLQEGADLLRLAAPSLAEDDADGGMVSPSTDSSGTPMYRKAPAMASDITRNRPSPEYGDTALSHGQPAPWSTPILSAEGGVLGTLDVYNSEPRRPLEIEERLVELATHIAAIAIENQRADLSLSQLSGRLLSLQDEERRRIARELHDSTGQILSALTLSLAVARRQATSIDQIVLERLSDAEGLAQAASTEIRTLSYLLHPPLLDESGLASALREYAKGFAERTGIGVELEIPSEWERLSQDSDTTLFRVAQEALTNVHRHSGSKTAKIRLIRSITEVTLEVQDTGIGMPPDTLDSTGGAATLGVGIRGMRERVRQLRGRLEIASDSNGTIVRAILPIADHKGLTPKG
jgi:PAS domain S-box-containing protein